MNTAIQTGLIALHANRAEVLADTVFAWLRQRPLAPLEEEIILVQSNGMAEWLKMALASEGGVCAATRVELPARFMWRTYRQVLGRDQVPLASPLDKIALTWRLMQQLPALLTVPGFEPVAGFLRPNEPDRLFQLASRLADLLDQYQVYRADWLQAWASGRDVLITPGRPDLPVPSEQAWQPMLWRALLATLDAHECASIRPRLHQRVLGVLQSGAPIAAPVARRVVLFGMTHLPLATLQMLAALAGHSQVLLAIPNPCRFHWADIMDGRELLRMERRRQPLRQGRDLAALPLDQMHAHAHPLLAAWGRQSRDFVRQLDEFDDAQASQARFAVPRIDLFDDTEAPDASLLTQVQNRIRDLLALDEHPAVAALAADRSIVFHIAHSAQREVEILHDQLLKLFADAPADRPLQPRDVVVMVPDIDPLAPAIRAVFGQYGRHDPRHIPFDIADLSARASSPLVNALTWLLRLPTQRVSLSEVRDLLEVPAVAARFGIAADALPRLTQWMAGAGIRWGLSEAHRVELGLGACGDQNTGWFGLRRMLMGYACGGVGGQAAFAGIEPYADVGGLEADLAGSLASLLERLLHWWGVARLPATPADWAMRGQALLSGIALAQDDADRQTLAAMDEALTTWQEACAQADFDGELPLSVAGQAWLDALEQPSLNKRFRAGGVTFCTLMPMRAIPFEVVCLLGMNNGDYPRRAQRSDFDLMGLAGQVRPGDRSRRDDDRQLMLEALLSARRVLYISWSGRSVRDNGEQPPSVLVSQLRDYLAAGWTGEVLAQRTTEHPLQPFSRRYFEPASGLFTFAREWRAAHAGDESTATADAIPALTAFEPDARVPLTVAQLGGFLRNPVKAFFRQRLSVVFDDIDEGGTDEEPFVITGLDEYALMRDVVNNVLADLSAARKFPADRGTDAGIGQAVAGRLRSLRRGGNLPMGGLGDRSEANLADALTPMLQAWQAVQSDYPLAASRQRLHFEHAGLQLEDWLDHLGLSIGADVRPTWLQLEPGKLCTDPAKGLIRIDKMILPWVRSLAAAASGVSAQGVLVGRDATLHIGAMPAELARDTLALLMDAWVQGLSRPLPLAPKTALAYLEGKGKAAEAYDGGHDQSGEGAEPCLNRLYPDFEALCADQQFENLAHKVYGPLRHWALNHVKAIAHGAADDAEQEVTA